MANSSAHTSQADERQDDVSARLDPSIVAPARNYPHGGNGAGLADSYGLDPSQIIDLSASLNPFAPPVAEIAAKHVDQLAHYPDPRPATGLLAETIGVNPERLLLTNGASEAIALVAQHLQRGSLSEPEFSLYRRHLLSISDGSENSDRRWRSNPNNPLGSLAPVNAKAQVWDEAFYPLATGEWSRGDDTSWRLGSLTKIWSCPGLRLGYVIAPSEADAAALARQQPRWSVNGLALAMIPELLEQTNLPAWASQISELRTHFAAALGALDLEVTPSTANWVLVKSDLALDQSLAPLGIAIRNCDTFGLPDMWRVAIPKPEQVEPILSAFQHCLNV